MELQRILNSNITKIAKGKELYSLGYTRHQVADLLCNGNFGHAHNIWRKWAQGANQMIVEAPISVAGYNFVFDRTFGVEIEAYNVNKTSLKNTLNELGINIVEEYYNHDTRGHWKIVRDASISGHNACEIVSPVLKGADGLEQLKKVCIALNKIGAKINKSCGLHIHLGVSDYDTDNFKNLLKSYINVENEVDKMMPATRRGNTNKYCRSMKMNKTAILMKRKIDEATGIENLADSVFSGGRYFKVNIQCYRRQKTIEFRQHSGSVQYSKIKNWILICARMVDYAKKIGEFDNLNTILNESLQEYVSDRQVDLVA